MNQTNPFAPTVLLSFATVLAGCLGAVQEAAPPAGSEGAPPAPLRVYAVDFALYAPRTVAAGLHEVVLDNRGSELHHVTFYRLEPGRTFEEFRDAYVADAAATPAWATAYGGPNVAPPGGSRTAYLELEPGEYVLACAIPSPGDHTMHAAKGMLAPLTVVPSDAPAPRPPAASLEVALRDFSFEMPPTVPAGDHRLRVVNEGTHSHELVLFELFGDATPQDVLGSLEGADGTAPPPGRPVAGVTPISPGKEVTALVELAPGRYFAVCFDVTGAPHGEPHFALGMLREFEVA